MRSTVTLLLALFALSCSQPGPEPPTVASAGQPKAHSGPLPHEEAWRDLLSAGRIEEGLGFCNELVVNGVDPLRIASGHACLANIALLACPGGDKAQCAEIALDQLQRALDAAPEARRVHSGRLRVLLDAGRPGELAGAMVSTLELRQGEASDAAHWLAYAIEMLQAGRVRETAAFTEVLRSRYPDHPGVLATLGACLTDLSRHDRAAEVLSHGIDLHPESGPLNWTSGWHYEKTGRHASAKAFFERALANAPDAETLSAWGCEYGRVLEGAAELNEACRYQREHCGDDVSALCSGRLQGP